MDPGHLELTLNCAQGRIAALGIVHHQAPATRLLLGLPVARAVALAPSLFTLCARAQGAAARAAGQAAQGNAGAAQDPVVAAEAAQEHLWRLMIDWPRELGLASQEKLFAHWRRLLLADPQALHGSDLLSFLGAGFFGMAPGEWLSISDTAALQAWAENGRSLAARLCKALLSEETEARAGIDPTETGAYARRQAEPLLAACAARPLLVRLLARLRELAAMVLQERSLPLPGAVVALALAPGRGLARVETARGALLHEMEIAEGRVLSYRIVAPTDINFRNQGPLASLLLGRDCAAAETAQVLARRAVLALDPCVAWTLQLA